MEFSKDRIVPDYFNSIFKNKALILRSPNSIRPWQHVIDPLYGYILLLMKLYNKKLNLNSFNFGPKKSDNKSVNSVIKLVNKDFNNSVKIIKKKGNSKDYPESRILLLNSHRSKKILSWQTKYNIQKSIKLTSTWFKDYLLKKNILRITQKQILDYFT